MFEKTEKDVQDALADYNLAIAAEDTALEKLELRKALELVDKSQLTASDKKMMEKKVSKYEKKFKDAGTARRNAKKEFNDRCKIRDAEILATNNEIVEKKENQIYFDGHTYTTRWSCLPA